MLGLCFLEVSRLISNTYMLPGILQSYEPPPVGTFINLNADPFFLHCDHGNQHCFCIIGSQTVANERSRLDLIHADELVFFHEVNKSYVKKFDDSHALIS